MEKNKAKFKPDFIDSKAKKIVLIVETVLCLVFFIPFYLRNQQLVAGFAADSNNNIAVVVNNVFGGEPLYLFVYDNNGDLLNYKTIRNIRGGIEVMTSEDDMICMHQYGFKHYYDFNGEYKKTENIDDRTVPSFESEKKIGNAVYRYSVNPIGFETVKKYTDENVVTLFSDVSFWIAKLFAGILIGGTLILCVYVIIFSEFNRKFF